MNNFLLSVIHLLLHIFSTLHMHSSNRYLYFGERIYIICILIYRKWHLFLACLSQSKLYHVERFLSILWQLCVWFDRSREIVMFVPTEAWPLGRGERENFPNFHPCDVVPDGFNINPASRHTETTDTLTYFQSTVMKTARKTDKNNRRSRKNKNGIASRFREA